MRNRLSLNAVMRCALLLAAGVVAACDDTSSNGAPRYGGQNAGVAVLTQPATLSDLRETLTSVGTARALKSVSVYAETSMPIAPFKLAICCCNWTIATRSLPWSWRVFSWQMRNDW